VPEADRSALTWESVDGAQGALTSVHTWNTTLAASKFTSFYSDAASQPPGQSSCRGDMAFYGASGPYVKGSINSTDEPSNGNAPSDRLTTTRTGGTGPPGRGPAGGAEAPRARALLTGVASLSLPGGYSPPRTCVSAPGAPTRREEIHMYARVARFEGADGDGLRRSVAEINSQVDSGPPEGVPAKGFLMLIDPDKGQGLAISLFDTEEDLKAGHEVLNSMSPPGDGMGQRSTVEMFEVGVDVRM
jgi:hypothetical protein